MFARTPSSIAELSYIVIIAVQCCLGKLWNRASEHWPRYAGQFAIMCVFSHFSLSLTLYAFAFLHFHHPLCLMLNKFKLFDTWSSLWPSRCSQQQQMFMEMFLSLFSDSALTQVRSATCETWETSVDINQFWSQWIEYEVCLLRRKIPAFILHESMLIHVSRCITDVKRL